MPLNCSATRWQFVSLFFFNYPATTEIYTRPYTLSLHDALPISRPLPRSGRAPPAARGGGGGRRGRSEEHTSELQSHGLISYAVFCLKKQNSLRRVVHRGGTTRGTGGVAQRGAC